MQLSPVERIADELLLQRDLINQKKVRQFDAMYGAARSDDNPTNKTDAKLSARSNVQPYVVVKCRPGTPRGIITIFEAVTARIFSSVMPTASFEANLRRELDTMTTEEKRDVFRGIFGDDLEKGISAITAQIHLKTGLGTNGVNPLVPGVGGGGMTPRIWNTLVS